jgi:hypothetical protein
MSGVKAMAESFAWPYRIMWCVAVALFKMIRDPIAYQMALDIYYSWWDEE